MKVDRALRRIARFSDVRTWAPELQRKYVAMMARRFGRTVTIAPRETFRGGVIRSPYAGVIPDDAVRAG